MARYTNYSNYKNFYKKYTEKKSAENDSLLKSGHDDRILAYKEKYTKLAEEKRQEKLEARRKSEEKKKYEEQREKEIEKRKVVEKERQQKELEEKRKAEEKRKYEEEQKRKEQEESDGNDVTVITDVFDGSENNDEIAEAGTALHLFRGIKPGDMISHWKVSSNEGVNHSNVEVNLVDLTGQYSFENGVDYTVGITSLGDVQIFLESLAVRKIILGRREEDPIELQTTIKHTDSRGNIVTEYTNLSGKNNPMYDENSNDSTDGNEDISSVITIVDSKYSHKDSTIAEFRIKDDNPDQVNIHDVTIYYHIENFWRGDKYYEFPKSLYEVKYENGIASITLTEGGQRRVEGRTQGDVYFDFKINIEAISADGSVNSLFVQTSHFNETGDPLKSVGTGGGSGGGTAEAPAGYKLVVKKEPDDSANEIHGTPEEDNLEGTVAKDIIFAKDSDDFVYGNNGQDKLYGEGGDDYIEGGSHADHIVGGDGNDILYQASQAGVAFDNTYGGTMYGGSGNDHLYGDKGKDWLYGNDGIDRLYGGEGEDILRGGDDKDYLYGEDENDRIYGDSGNDHLYGGEGDDDLYGGDDNDILHGWNGFDHLEGGNGNDEIFGGDNDDSLHGGDGDDVMYSDHMPTFSGSILTGGMGHNNSTMYGGNGNDLITGALGVDIVEGGNGNDFIYTFNGNDTINGGDGVDLIDGGAHDDILHGGKGDDILYGGEGEDTIYGGDGNDIIEGGKHNDTIYSGKGADVIEGGDGNDIIYVEGGALIDSGSFSIRGNTVNGGKGDDTIYGGDADDLLIGGNGDDTIYGGHGNDVLSAEGLNAGNYDNSSNFLFGGYGSDMIIASGAATTAYGGDEDSFNSYETPWGTSITSDGQADVFTFDFENTHYLSELEIIDFEKGIDKIMIPIEYKGLLKYQTRGDANDQQHFDTNTAVLMGSAEASSLGEIGVPSNFGEIVSAGVDLAGQNIDNIIGYALDEFQKILVGDTPQLIDVYRDAAEFVDNVTNGFIDFTTPYQSPDWTSNTYNDLHDAGWTYHQDDFFTYYQGDEGVPNDYGLNFKFNFKGGFNNNDVVWNIYTPNVELTESDFIFV